MTEPKTLAAAVGAKTGPGMIHHTAYVTHDAAATVDFYSTILGLPLCSTVIDDHVPSTGEAIPYLHLFFRLPDDSTIAFFECPGIPQAAPSAHPAYDTFNHLALKVPSQEDVMHWKEWLESNGVRVIGPTDHKIIYSIYFHDPNGLRLELTANLDEVWNRHEDAARNDVDMWEAVKREARGKGEDVSRALLRFISSKKAARENPVS